MKNSLEIQSENNLMLRFSEIQKAQGSKISIRLIILAVFVLINIGVSKAVPSYARQTGMSCSACHYSFPELNSFGRQFKMNGYVLTGMTTIESREDSSSATRLKLLSNLPLSAMVQSSFTHIAKDVPETQNNSVTLPQQLSLFYAGQITPHIGTFIQMTYDGQSFGMDNVDIRYTNQAKIKGRNLVYGLTLNNNPSVQDVWNTSPAWRFPSAGSDAAKTPVKSTIMENLGSQVAGLGAYTLFNNLLFAEVTMYRSAQQGAPNPAGMSSETVINGVAPYWRLALQHQWTNNYLEIGAFGIEPKFFNKGISGKITTIKDFGIDLQYEHNLSFAAVTFHSALIQEKTSREISDLIRKYYFNSLKIDANLYLKNGLGATAGYFYTVGSTDLRIDSWSNKPDSNGFIGQIEYLPWYNTKFAVQYVAYTKFDGTVFIYDGNMRNAIDNNTIYLVVWLNF